MRRCAPEMTEPRGRREGILEEFARLAPRYDARWSFYVEATARETLARLELRSGDRLLDVGCGTGALLEALARHPLGIGLAGVDPSSRMLEIARAKLAPRAGAPVDLRIGWAEEIPHEAASFDVVTSCSVFHYCLDPKRALAEARRVLRPGGRLLITDWCDDYLTCRLCDLYLRARNRPYYRIYGAEELKRLIEEAGLARVRVARYRISLLWGLMTATAERPAG